MQINQSINQVVSTPAHCQDSYCFNAKKYLSYDDQSRYDRNRSSFFFSKCRVPPNTLHTTELSNAIFCTMQEVFHQLISNNNEGNKFSAARELGKQSNIIPLRRTAPWSSGQSL